MLLLHYQAVALLLFTFYCNYINAVSTTYRSSNVFTRIDQVDNEYDSILAGAGTAGLTLGDRLSADGKYSVLVIECGVLDNSSAILSGGVMSGRAASREFNISSVPQLGLNNRSIPVVVGKLVGGSSAINGLQSFRGTKEEYDLWAQVGGNGSTWDWNGMLPYFKRGMHFVPPLDQLAKDFNMSWDLSVWGQDDDTRVYAGFPNYLPPELKLFYQGMALMPEVDVPKDGNAGTHGLFFYPSTMNPATYTRSYARTGHWDGIYRSNYHLLIKSRVIKIEFDGERATGFSVVPVANISTHPRIIRARKEVILAAGTIHTPQILQLSGIGPAKLLSAANIPIKIDLPGVGENFQDHGYIPGPRFSWGIQPPVSAINNSGDPRTGLTSNLAAVIGLPAICPNKVEELAHAFESQHPDQYLPKDVHPYVLAGFKAQKDAFAKIFRNKNTAWLWLILFGSPTFNPANQHPFSRGSVHINTSDLTAEPIVDYRALSNPIDIATTIEMLRFTRKYIASEIFAPYRPTEILPGANVTTDKQLGDWIRSKYVPSVYHPVGTAAKMPRELGGVVDEELLVYGVKGLSIVDASIIPIIPGAPTVLTTYTIAEKAAEFIKRRS